MKKFNELDEGFICENCNKEVSPLRYSSRDHCPFCLYSKHVDINPGDRNNTCKGLLKPIGIEKYNGDACNIVANANVINATCDRPSPIIEFFLRTVDTPIKDAHKEISTPTIKALIINEYENISIILLMVNPPYKFFSGFRYNCSISN